jgi:hypothetical protein
MMKQDIHVFQGMRKDNHPIRQDSKFLWEAHNIRFTSDDDNTLMAMTNEKGTKDTGIALTGNYMGHCVVGDYIVVFTTGNYIYRISANPWKAEQIYKGNLNITSIVKTLGIYEGTYIQKVYWIDNYNQPRVINIVADQLFDSKVTAIKEDTTLTDDEKTAKIQETLYPEGSFDFTPTLNLEERVAITTQKTGGTFSPGVHQYAFSYFNKYGQESNLFYTSRLFNVAPEGRGGNPEEKCSNSFKIEISNLETKFQFLRIYSIHRTSLNAVPLVKVVTDIELINNSISFIDDGLIGYNIDSSKLMFIGGESITAGCITQKDNTLFLGNIKIKRPSLSYIKDTISRLKNDYLDASQNSPSTYVGLKKLSFYENTLNFYDYHNQLIIDSATDSTVKNDVTTFKVGDYYRLGVQFQHESGKWSEPVWLQDYQISYNKNNRPSFTTDDDTGKRILNLHNIGYYLTKSSSGDTEAVLADKKELETCLGLFGYINMRPVIVYPTINDRMTMAQGVLCPTVFSVDFRKAGSPFAQSSWFFRPMGTGITADNNNNTDIEKGATIAFKHLEPLFSPTAAPYTTGEAFEGGYFRGAEIQNMQYNSFDDANKKIAAGDNVNTFFVDQSIVTMHSPDIEFDDTIADAINNKLFKLKIVGLAEMRENAGDINIQTSSANPFSTDEGFYHKSMLSTNYENKGLIAGLFYKSHTVCSGSVENTETQIWELKYGWGTEINSKKEFDGSEYSWMVYPWHRSGSLNNDAVRAEGKGTRTAELKKKVISNLRVFRDNIWLDDNKIWSPDAGITNVFIFNSNEVSLIKIPAPEGSGIKILNYYGNVDTMVTTTTEYNFFVADNTSKSNPFTTVSLERLAKGKQIHSDSLTTLVETKDPVRMKYKSSPHAVFAFNYNGLAWDTQGKFTSPVVLPSIKVGNNTWYNVAQNKDSIPYWIELSDGDAKQEKWETVSVDKIVIVNPWKFEEEETYGARHQTVINYLNRTYTTVTVNTVYIVKNIYYPGNDTYYELYRKGGTTWETHDILKTAYYIYTEDNVTTHFKPHTISIEDLPTEIIPDSQRERTVLEKQNSGFNPETVVNYKTEQGEVVNLNNTHPCLFIAELVRQEKPVNMFGGDTEEALRNNLWIPAGEPVSVKTGVLTYDWGDTYYQRYDCLKTYPFTKEDENSIVEIGSFMCETRINIDGRYDRNRGQLSNLNMSPTNFNLLNNVYTQKNNFFNYRILDDYYYKNTEYPAQVVWSLEKTPLADVDAWTNVTLANSVDLNGEQGKLVSLETFNENLIAFQERAINQILFNSRVQIPTSEGVPVEISNSYKVDGTRYLSDNIGCQNKWSLVNSPLGIYFVDNLTDTLYLYNGEIKDLSTSLGGKWWFNENHPSDNNYMRLGYDRNNKDVYISYGGNESLCYSEQLGCFTSLVSYSDAWLLPFKDKFLSLKKDDTGSLKLWENLEGDYNVFFNKVEMPEFTYICNEDSTYTKIFDTIEYRADIYKNDGITLLHNKSFDWIQAHNEYQNSIRSSLSQLRRKTTDSTFRGVSLDKKFRVWRAQIPRQAYSRSRMRNPWTAITLGYYTSATMDDNKFKMVLHDISTKYTV